MQDWLQMTTIQTSDVIDKNEDGSDITQDVDVLVWWRDVGHVRFPHIAHGSSIPVYSSGWCNI
jgi:hypothetical protein